MSLVHGTNLNKGVSGVKRSSWKRIHFRDLALKVCEEHPDSNVEELAESFLSELERFPDYMESIAVYIMANVRASLNIRRSEGSRQDPRTAAAAAAVGNLTKKIVARVLLDFQMPSGKTLRESTGGDCMKAGGWLKAVGLAAGKSAIVGDKLTEDQLQKLFKDNIVIHREKAK